MNDVLSKTFKAERNQYPILLSFVCDYVKKYTDNKNKLNDIEICMGEVFSNIESYGSSQENIKCDVEVELNYDDDKIIIVFKDNGVQFNPLQFIANTPEFNRNHKIVGGFGILMVKKLMNDVSYKYENGLNILTLIKSLKED